MKLAIGLASIAVFSWSLIVSEPEDWEIVIGGNTLGYLSPCGCAKPMKGGIRRRIAATVHLAEGRKLLSLDTGNLASGVGRQDEIKAESLAEAFRLGKIDAINLGGRDADLGLPMVEAINRLSGDRLISSNLVGGAISLRSRVVKGPFVVAGTSPDGAMIGARLGVASLPTDDVVVDLLEFARTNKKLPILMTQGGEDHARELAKKHSKLFMIVYQSETQPRREPLIVGKTWIVSPGMKGQALISMRVKGDRLEDYRVVELGPTWENDAGAEKIYRRYVQRVSDENLIEELPRLEGPEFAGTAACATCHSASADVWKMSAHAAALKTLEREGHDRDPECISCHVVGMQSVMGFRTRTTTPDLANVGCESCHGAGRQHATSPMQISMPKSGVESCLPCHVPEHSPEFDFDEYWKLIQH
ncbi:MAG: hypothetical protein IH944_14295 [Armatimonadetes bacterium]|nr:hypothetical protein [Armatimonadota bacterium]